jgi:hypothetical protein
MKPSSIFELHLEVLEFEKKVSQLKLYGFQLGRRGFKPPKYVFQNKNWDSMFALESKNHTTLVYTCLLTIGIYQLDYL